MLSVLPPPGAGVGPSPGNAEVEKKAEASDLLQALSLLQRIMSPEDFVKYQVLVAPPKPGKTREQELADRVKSLQRLRTQETTHRGAIDKLELDLQQGMNPAPHIHEHLRYTIMATALRTPSRITTSRLSTLR